jgi:sulfur carrier protein ThiS
MQVFINQIPGSRRSTQLTEGATIRDALAALNISLEGSELRLNNTFVQASVALREGDEVFVTQKVKGNEVR